MPDGSLKKVYDAVSTKYDLGSYDEFSQKIQDPNSRQKLYNAVSKDFDLGDYNTFNQKLGFDSQEVKQQTNDFANAKPPTGTISNQQVNQAQQHINSLPQQSTEQKDVADYGAKVSKDNEDKLRKAAVNTFQKTMGKGSYTPQDSTKYVNDLMTGVGNGDLGITKDAQGNDVIKNKGGFLESFKAAADQAYAQDIENKYLRSIPKDEAISYLNRIADKPETGIVKESNIAPNELGQAVGEQSQLLGKGTIGSLAGAETAATGGATIGSFAAMASDLANSGYSNALKKNYYSLKKEGLSDSEAFDKATHAALTGEAVSLGQGVLLSGEIPLKSKAPNVEAQQGFLNSLGHTAKSAPKVVGSAMAGSVVNDIQQNAISNGNPVDAKQMLDNSIEAGKSMATLHGALGVLTAVANGRKTVVPSYVRPQAENVVASADRTQVANYLQTKESSGELPQGTTAKVLNTLSNFDKQKQVVAPFRISEESKAAIAGKLVQKQKLLDEKAALKPNENAFPERIQEIDKNISGIDGEINKLYNSKNPYERDVDNLTGEKNFQPKTFEELKPQEKDGITVPTDYGKAEVVEKGESENKTFKPKAYYVEQQGALGIRKNIPIESESFTDKEKAQEAADNALKQHYYENGLHDNAKPDKPIENEEASKPNEKTNDVIEPTKLPSNESEQKQKDVGETLSAQQKGKSAVEPPKPIEEMNSEELYNYANDVKKELKKQDKSFEGKTEEEKDKGGYYNVIDNVEDLKATSTRLNYIENAENLDDLASSAKSTLLNIKNKPSEYDNALLNGIRKKAEELKIEPETLIKEVLKKVGNKYADQSDAEFMMKSIMDKLVPKEEPKKQLTEQPKENIQEQTPTVKEEAPKQISSPINTENNASTQSSEQQQASNTESSKPEYARTEQTGSETKTTSSKNSDSNIGSQSEEKDLGSKARNLAKDLREGKKNVLPSWLKADLPKGTEGAGISLNEAFANALDAFADIHDKTKDFAKAVEAGFKHLKDWFDENNVPYDEKDLKAKFEDEMNGNVENDVTSIKNATTQLRREQYGLDKEIPAAKKEFGETWDKAQKKIESGYDPQDLVDELAKKPRPLNDEENAILLHYQNGKEIRLENLNNQINEAAEKGDNKSLEEAKVAKARVLDELQKLYDVNKAVGTENARGLNSRKMMADRKYSLANMIAEKRASSNDGKPLSDAQQKEIEDLHEKINETQKAFDDYVKQAESDYKELQEKILGKKITDKKSTADKLRSWADKFEKENAGKTFATVVPITPKMIADAVRLIADGVQKGGELLDLIKEQVEKIKKDNPDIDEAKLNKAINKTVIDSGINSVKKAPTDLSTLLSGGKLDRKALALKAANERAKEEFDISLKKDAEKKKKVLGKAQDVFVKWQRGFKLSNPLTMGKLMMAGLTRLTTTPLEDIVGAGYSAIMPKLAKGAIGEGGGLNVKETAKAYKNGLLEGMKDAGALLAKGKHGKSDIDIVFGKRGDLPPEAIDFFGQLHSATKAPIKRFAFERSLEKRLRRNIANGVDVSDPMVQTSILVDAYKDANRAIFMQDNSVSTGWQKMVDYLEKNNAKPAATTLKFLLPFVKVPTNIAAETGTHVYGVPVAAAKLLKAGFTNGMKDLTPEEKDVIFRNLKKGTLGLAAMTLGYMNPQNFGGYYQKGQKRGEDEAQALGLKLFGHKIPAWFVESPIFQAMQLGATVRRVKDETVKGQAKGIGEGLWAGALGLADRVPMIDQPIRVAGLFGSQKDREYYMGELAKSTVDPALLTYMANVTDPADKQSVAGKILNPQNNRSPQTMVEHIKSGLPYFREQVGEKPMSFSKKEIQKNPTLKYFTDSGLQMPNTSLSSEKINFVDKNGDYQHRNISDYPKNIQDKYKEEHNNQLINVLEPIASGEQTVFVKYSKNAKGEQVSEVVFNEPNEGNYKEKSVKELTKPEKAQVLSIAQGMATKAAKKEVFGEDYDENQ